MAKKGKRTVDRVEDIETINNVMYSPDAGAQYELAVLPVPERPLDAGNNILGRGKKVWLGTAGYTLKDSTGELSDIVVPGAMAPVGSVVSLGLSYDTIEIGAGCFLVADFSKVTDQ
jgi:hypothetical protein